MTSTATEVSQVQSLAAIRNFIRVAVSCVTYLRGLCSDESYQPRQFLGLQLKQLVRSSPEADAISQWMEEGAFDALNKGYLKELTLCIYTPSCTELLESYCFTLSYSPDGQRASLTFTGNSQKDGANNSSSLAVPHMLTSMKKRKRQTRQEVQQALAGIITKVMEVVEGLPPLLCERVLAMQLTYYEDITPPSYEPPCFAPANSHLVNLHRQEQNNSTHIASLDTGHHSMSVTIRHPFFDRLKSHNSSLISTNSTITMSATETAVTEEEEKQQQEERRGVAAAALRQREDMNAAAYRKEHKNKEFSQEQQSKSNINKKESNSTYLDDITFFVFTSFVLTKSPDIYRGRISIGEIKEYLRVSCPLEISIDMVYHIMRKLEKEGVITLGMHQEWIISAIPAVNLARLIITKPNVVRLLSPQIREDLEKLITVKSSTRVSVAGTRKRPRKNI